MDPKDILIIDDDQMLSGIVEEFLTDQGYSVRVAKNGKTGIKMAKETPPQLIVLDVEMPDMTGFQVCKKLREIPTLRHTPVIMLTGRTTEKDEVRGFQMGADDYVAKPFKPKLLLTRIKSSIGRSTKQLSANALTHLPGNMSIMTELEKRISEEKKFSVLYMDLNNFKAFNDTFGFVKGDEAIQLTVSVLSKCFDGFNRTKTFLGHIGGDDFVGIVDSHAVESLCKELIKEFDRAIVTLYPDEARKRGYITSVDRQGKQTNIPLMGLSVAVVTNKHREFEHPGEIALIAGDLKKRVKKENRSAYLMDRRSKTSGE